MNPFAIGMVDKLVQKMHLLLQQGKLRKQHLVFMYLDNIFDFALNGSTQKSNFAWHPEVIEWFTSVKFLGGKKLFNFVWGRGFANTGQYWASENALKHVKSYQTFHGIKYIF